MRKERGVRKEKGVVEGGTRGERKGEKGRERERKGEKGRER